MENAYLKVLNITNIGTNVTTILEIEPFNDPSAWFITTNILNVKTTMNVIFLFKSTMRKSTTIKFFELPKATLSDDNLLMQWEIPSGRFFIILNECFPLY